jgi:hypothetical protein
MSEILLTSQMNDSAVPAELVYNALFASSSTTTYDLQLEQLLRKKEKKKWKRKSARFSLGNKSISREKQPIKNHEVDTPTR